MQCLHSKQSFSCVSIVEYYLLPDIFDIFTELSTFTLLFNISGVKTDTRGVLLFTHKYYNNSSHSNNFVEDKLSHTVAPNYPVTFYGCRNVWRYIRLFGSTKQSEQGESAVESFAAVVFAASSRESHLTERHSAVTASNGQS
jgi:hypothetical protein